MSAGIQEIKAYGEPRHLVPIEEAIVMSHRMEDSDDRSCGSDKQHAFLFA